MTKASMIKWTRSLVEQLHRLKGAGFRWTPSLGCWQAYRNHRALSVAKAIAGVAS